MKFEIIHKGECLSRSIEYGLGCLGYKAIDVLHNDSFALVIDGVEDKENPLKGLKKLYILLDILQEKAFLITTTKFINDNYIAIPASNEVCFSKYYTK